MEYNALKIVKENHELILVSEYNPPDNNLSYPQISKFFKELESFKKVIISGDLNAQHSACGSDWNNANGKNLTKSLEDALHLHIVNSGAVTRMHSMKSAPDVTIVSSDLVDQVIWEVGEDSLGSDHLPVSITLPNHKFHADRVPTKLNLSPIDWDTFI